MEIHNYIPDYLNDTYEFFKFFENNTWDRILGLSGSIDLGKLPRLTRIAPIVKTITTSEAVKLGLVSTFAIYNVPLELTEEEHKEYVALSSKIENASLYNKASWKYVQKRKTLLANAESKYKATLNILSCFKEKKGIIFSEFKTMADRITEGIGPKAISYHSGLTKVQRDKNFALYNSPLTPVKYISTVKALNEGANIPELGFGIITGSSSKERELIQRLGRIIRKEQNKNAILVRFYIKNSQEYKWIEKAQTGFEVKNMDNLDNLMAEIC